MSKGSSWISRNGKGPLEVHELFAMVSGFVFATVTVVAIVIL